MIKSYWYQCIWRFISSLTDIKLMPSSDSNWHVHNYVRCVSNYLSLNYVSSFIWKSYPHKITPFSGNKIHFEANLPHSFVHSHSQTYNLKGDISKQLTLAKTIPLFRSRNISLRHLNSNSPHLIYIVFEI